MTDPIQSLYRGALLGLAVGEARGWAAESGNDGGPAPHDTAIHGPATATALLLAQSLLDTRGFDAEDQRSRYRAWVRGEGASSSGRTLSASLAVQTAEAAAATADSEDAAALGGPSHATQWRVAVYGQLAGARRGAGAIPEEWLTRLPERETIETLAERLLLETAQSIRHFTSWQKKPSTGRAAR